MIIGISAGLMYLVTTFLFAFSGGQSRMVSVANYGAIVVVAGTVLIAAVVWIRRSGAAAAKWAAIATLVGWVLASLAEWLISFRLGAT